MHNNYAFAVLASQKRVLGRVIEKQSQPPAFCMMHIIYYAYICKSGVFPMT